MHVHGQVHGKDACLALQSLQPQAPEIEERPRFQDTLVWENAAGTLGSWLQPLDQVAGPELAYGSSIAQSCVEGGSHFSEELPHVHVLQPSGGSLANR